MALKASVFKAQLSVSDLTRSHYQDYALTLARHPSETDERMMVRVLAFALNAADDLQFTKGLSTDDEPDLWQKDLTGDIQHWLEVGLPSEDRLRKACGRSRQVTVYAYGTDKVQQQWRDATAAVAGRFDRLARYGVTVHAGDLAALAAPGMQLQCTIDGADVWLSSDDQQVSVQLTEFE